ncbi:hypothetical protein BVX98_07850, partial [bacterium F11]
YQPPQENQPTVILLHGLQSTKKEWNSFATACGKKGWGVLAYDARGHGESSKTKDKKGRPNGFQYMGSPGPGSRWERMIDDVGAVLRFCKNKDPKKKHTFFLGGASLGANVSLNYAALSRSIQGVFLLSPGLTYVGISTEDPVKKMKRPILIVVSSADHYAHQSSLALKRANPQVQLWSDVKEGHGVQMFDQKLISRILQWLDKKK